MKEPAHEAPQNIASASDQITLDIMISEIEDILRNIGITKSLSTIPILVTDQISGDGKCSLTGSQNYIAIHKDLFHYEDLDSNIDQIPRLWFVLLHEIGHCYFYRHHESKKILPTRGYVFTFINKVNTDLGYLCFHSYKESWPATVMGPNGLSTAPSSLKTFYVEELIGNVQEPTAADLLNHKGIRLVENTQATESSTPLSCLTH